MFEIITNMRHRRQQRAALKRIETYDDRLLANVGLTAADLRALRYGRVS